jgi:hypothetical protein
MLTKQFIKQLRKKQEVVYSRNLSTDKGIRVRYCKNCLMFAKSYEIENFDDVSYLGKRGKTSLDKFV